MGKILTLVKASLKSLIKELNTAKNLLPLIIDCVKNKCTLGEISDAMRSVHGEYI